MKTLFFTLITLTSLSFPCFSTSNFEGGEEDSLYTVEIDGKIALPDNDPSNIYKLELLSDNVVLESGIVVDNESFLLRVKRNSLYTIRITKEGYSPMVVTLNTNVRDNDYKFRFDDGYFLTLYGFQLSLALHNQL